MKHLLFLISLFLVSTFSSAQLYKEYGWGVEGIYNLPAEGIGVAGRCQIHLNAVFVAVPKVDYYLPFNKVHELLIGGDLQARVQSWREWGFYGIVGPYYNHWFNYEDSSHPKRKASNFAVEAGVGFTKNYGCWRPYAEYRVNTKWEEANVRLGVAFYLKDCRKHGDCAPYYK